MSDITFVCPRCKEALTVDEAEAGQSVKCPLCTGLITIPEVKIVKPVEVPPEPQEQTKKCPYCAEVILVDAIKCKHCGTMLDGSGEVKIVRRWSGFTFLLLGILTLLAPIAGIIFGIIGMRTPANKDMGGALFIFGAVEMVVVYILFNIGVL